MPQGSDVKRSPSAQWWGLRFLVFLGAFLLFTLEPFVGRSLVTQFGGSIHVWLVSLMFFQAMLFVGYAYAHLLARYIGGWHLLIALTPLLLMPIGVQYGASDGFSIPELMLVLFLNIGLPFGVLATTAVVVQSWIADSQFGETGEPYSLYGASNAGSLAGLLCYPFLIEPLSGLKSQSLLWTVLFAVYLVILFLGWRALRPGRQIERPSESTVDADVSSPTRRDYLMWLLLSSLPSAYLLSVTNYIGTEVGSFPLVWVIPLALYLLSFIITFRDDGGCPPVLNRYLFELVAAGFLLYVWPISLLALVGHLVVFTAICLMAHGELYDRRPATRFLTHYYLTIAAGGWLGGVAISLIAPQLFTGLYDYAIILAMVGFVLYRCHREVIKEVYRQASIVSATFRLLVIMLSLTVVCLAVFLSNQGERFRHRNFYGTYRVLDVPANDATPVALRQLVHGSTLHGAQITTPAKTAEPVSYYHANGAISHAFNSVDSPRRIAVIGLGAGVLSALTSEGDRLTYYELDPDNEQIAREWFTFLDEARGEVKVVSGDGRLRLRQSDETYDLLVLDAFTGDGIPTHLLTKEAFAEYLQRLSPDGILLLHITNRYYDLRPVLKSIAREHQLHGAMNIFQRNSQPLTYHLDSQCIVLSRDPDALRSLLDQGWVELGENDGLPSVTVWTDDYINVISPLIVKLRHQWIGSNDQSQRDAVKTRHAQR